MRGFWVVPAITAGPVAAGALVIYRPLAALLLCGASLAAAVPRVRLPAETVARAGFLLLLLTALPWAASSLTTLGSVHTDTRAAKAKLVLLGVAAAAAFLSRRHVGLPTSTRLLLLYGAIATVGGILTAGGHDGVLRGGRFVVTVLAAQWCASRLGRSGVLRLTIWASTVLVGLSLVAALAGVTSMTDGRLVGLWASLHPNELGFVAALALVGVAVAWTQNTFETRAALVCASVLAPALILTGSRTALVALVAALLVVAVPAVRSRGPAIALGLSVVVLCAAFVQTNTTHKPLHDLVTHNGTTTLYGTFDVRSFGWQAAVRANDTLPLKLFGHGLNVKSVRVDLAYTPYAGVDGTWYAAYLSAGILGVGALAAFVLVLLLRCVRARDRLGLALLVYIVAASLLQDSLNDVSFGLVAAVGLLTQQDQAPADRRSLT